MTTIKKETHLQAYQAGHKKYLTGKPCARGHTGPYYTSSGHCCECHAESARRRRESAMGDALVPVTVRVPGNHAQTLRDYAEALRGLVE